MERYYIEIGWRIGTNVATIIQSVKIENAWGFLNLDEEFLSDEEAHKLAVSDSFYYNNNNGQLLQLPFDALELSPELFVNILYGKNGTGKSTFLKLIDDGIELVNGLVKQYIVQNKNRLSNEDARSWTEGGLPLRTIMKGDSRKIKSISYANNLFVQNLLQSSNGIYAKSINDAKEMGIMDLENRGSFSTEGKGAQEPWWNNISVGKDAKEFLFQIKGYHTPEDDGTVYSFEISFERLDLTCFSKHLIANDRISNIGNAGYVVKCDIKPSETQYKLELSEDPDSNQTYVLSINESPEVYDFDADDLTYRKWQEQSCIPFVINAEHEIITLGNHSIDWDSKFNPNDPIHQRNTVVPTPVNFFPKSQRWNEIDHQYLEDDSYFKAIEKKEPDKRTEKELDDWAEFFTTYHFNRVGYWLSSSFGGGEYFFLNPTKTPENLQKYIVGLTGSSRIDVNFEFGYDNPDYSDGDGGDGVGADTVKVLKDIGKGLSSEYSYSLNSKSNEISLPLFDGPKRKIQSKDIYDSKMYTSLWGVVNELTNNSPNIESLPETYKFHEKITKDSKEDLNESIIEFFNYLNESTLGTMIKDIPVKYKDRYYGFWNITIRPNEETIVDQIRNRLEFLWSEGISRLVYHNRYETACNCLEEFTGLIMKNPGKKVFSSKYLKRKNTGASVKYEHLSSGERSIFNLISILASTEQKGPVFIDEPELSLHPAWQLEFNDLVVELVKHSRRQVFFASHSPDIVMPLISRAFPVEQSEGEH